MMVQDGEYDEHFDRQHKAVVLPGEGEGKQVIPIEGFRKTA